jgi:hypothetical protein
VFDIVFTLIDLRSFSNIWFWIVLAVMWSSVSHYVLGVPFDMVLRAQRRRGEALDELEAFARLQVSRRAHILETGGVWITGVWTTLVTVVAILGFRHGIELAQAFALLLMPLTLVGLLMIRDIRRMQADMPTGDLLIRRLRWHRFWVQAVGIVAILVTSLWGMWVIMSTPVLG